MSVSRQVAVTVIGDLVAISACAILAWWTKSLSDPSLTLAPYLSALPMFLVAAAATYAGLGLYPAIGWGAADELRRLSHGTTLVFFASVAVTFLSKAGAEWSRQVFLVGWGLSLVVVPISRAMWRRICCSTTWWGIPCVVLGAGATGERIIRMLSSRPWLGLRPVVLLDDDQLKHGSEVAGLRVAGGLHEVATIGVRHAILAMPGLPADRQSRLLDRLGDHLRHVFIAPALPGSPDLIAETREFANTLVLEVRQNLLRPGARLLKRSLDFIAVIVGLLMFSWLFAAIALVVKLSSAGPVFYSQRRLGRGGREFNAWKFRSMVKDADVLLQSYLQQHPELREQWERDHKLKDDPRITWIGRILRRTSLDELPQLWNILCGDMSLVGPRPIVQAEVAKYGDHYELYGKVRPGLSGLWQVSGRNDTTYAERVALDCYYVRNWSVWLDLVILARTVRVVVRGGGAY